MRPPRIIIDEVSGIEIPNPDYEWWIAGYEACGADVVTLIDHLGRVTIELMNEITKQGVKRIQELK